MKIDGYEVGKPAIGIDFDGTIHSAHKGYIGKDIYGYVIPGAKESIDILKKTYRIVVITSRCPIKEIKRWLDKNNVFYDTVTHLKTFCILYIDDRGIRFTNWKETMGFINERKNL